MVKRDNIFNRVKKAPNHYIYNILILCLLFIFFPISLENQNLNKNNLLLSDSEIFLKIKGQSRQQILHNGSIYF